VSVYPHSIGQRTFTQRHLRIFHTEFLPICKGNLMEEQLLLAYSMWLSYTVDASVSLTKMASARNDEKY